MSICTRSVISALLGVSIMGAARPVLSQSLADVARQEQERREGVKAPAKVLTNKDLARPPVTTGERPAAATGQGEYLPTGQSLNPETKDATASASTPKA